MVIIHEIRDLICDKRHATPPRLSIKGCTFCSSSEIFHSPTAFRLEVIVQTKASSVSLALENVSCRVNGNRFPIRDNNHRDIERHTASTSGGAGGLLRLQEVELLLVAV